MNGGKAQQSAVEMSQHDTLTLGGNAEDLGASSTKGREGAAKSRASV